MIPADTRDSSLEDGQPERLDVSSMRREVTEFFVELQSEVDQLIADLESERRSASE